ncbi:MULTISPECIES: ATP-binding protein [Eubacteriales]|jgi:predicted AAA+ superfamily ATPase|uniref:ATP-binding protein n=5 Tax=Lachnospiraceae TaxID=186803 RepID=A0AAE3A7F3_9FIRM|nr:MULTISPECIES: ATP-binding protein [Clostridia]MCC2125967.1 ATP-binding protein [Hominiventricola filiformis]MCC2168327.1 ATP-binding protein [Gallintestinimicrobium propionicum]MCC2169581.1 ATP-binding protein [Clostridium fessum]
MEKPVMELNEQYPVLLLTGPRQVGKTTMLEHLIEVEGKGRKKVSLDDLTLRELAKTDPKMFFQLYQPPLLIDEVQYAPELFPYIKIMVDERHQPGDFWLTGSQLFKMMEGVQESLAGRVALLHLSPLSQSEIMKRPPEPPFSLELPLLSERQNGRQMLNTPEVFQHIHQGGMPALVTGTYSNASIFYSSYIDTYMERDVRRLSNDIDSLKFLRFLRSVAARTSQQVNYKGIADDAEIDQTTAKNWLHVLEALGIIFLLEPYSNNVLKRTVSTPKLYFYDSGIVCYLTRWSSPETAMEGAMSGALLENYTVAEIIKTYQNAGQEPFLYYYRDKDAREIDLILERDGKLFPIEIKKMASPPKKLTKVFDLIDKSPLQRGTGAILCMADQLGAFDQNNLIVPISLI